LSSPNRLESGTILESIDEEKEGLLEMKGGVLVVKACDQQTKPTVKIVHASTMLPRRHFRMNLMLVEIDFGFLLAGRRIK
jgi:hypothetical protein